MNNSELSYSTVPAFLSKLWSLVEDPSTADIICWDASGQSFHVLDQARFAREILPLYFKHRNIASFIRQLNMYGFRKVINTDAPNIKIENDDLEFAHQYFIRYQEHLLEHIKRKIPGTRSIENAPNLPRDNIVKMVNDVKSLKVKQETMSEKFEHMKLENDVLWREVVNLRQQNIKQQEILNKLIQFLMSLVSKDRASIKRKMPLMITTATPLPTATSSLEPSAKIVRKTTFVKPTINIIPKAVASQNPLLEPLAVVDIAEALPSAQLTDCFELIDDRHVVNFTEPPRSGLNTPQLNLPHAPQLISGPSNQDALNTGQFNAGKPNTVIINKGQSNNEESNKGQSSTKQGNEKNLNSLQTSALPKLELVPKQESLLNEKEDILQHMEILQSGIDNLRELFTSGQYSFDPATLFELFGSEGPSVANSNLMFGSGDELISNDMQNLNDIVSNSSRGGSHLMALSAPPQSSPNLNQQNENLSYLEMPLAEEFSHDESLISDKDKMVDDINVEDFLLGSNEIYDDFLDYDSIID